MLPAGREHNHIAKQVWRRIMQNEWRGFQRGKLGGRDQCQRFYPENYTPYDGDDSFLEGPTQDTTDLWNEVLELSKQEREAGGVLGYGYQDYLHDHIPRTGLSGQEQGEDCRLSDR